MAKPIALVTGARGGIGGRDAAPLLWRRALSRGAHPARRGWIHNLRSEEGNDVFITFITAL